MSTATYVCNVVRNFDLRHNRGDVVLALRQTLYRDGQAVERPDKNGTVQERNAWKTDHEQQLAAIESAELAAYSRAAKKILAVLPDCVEDAEKMVNQSIPSPLFTAEAYSAASRAIAYNFNEPVFGFGTGWRMAIGGLEAGEMYHALCAISIAVLRQIQPVVEYTQSLGCQGIDERCRLRMLAACQATIRGAADAAVNRFLADHAHIISEMIDEVFQSVARIIGVEYR